MYLLVKKAKVTARNQLSATDGTFARPQRLYSSSYESMLTAVAMAPKTQ